MEIVRKLSPLVTSCPTMMDMHEAFVRRSDPDEVLTSEYRTTQHRLFTTDASVCTILAAINTEARTGFLGHFLPEDMECASFITEAVHTILSLGAPKSTRIHLGGGGSYFSDGTYLECTGLQQEMEDHIVAMSRQLMPEAAVVVSLLSGNDEADAEINCLTNSLCIRERLT